MQEDTKLLCLVSQKIQTFGSVLLNASLSYINCIKGIKMNWLPILTAREISSRFVFKGKYKLAKNFSRLQSSFVKKNAPLDSRNATCHKPPVFKLKNYGFFLFNELIFLLNYRWLEGITSLLRPEFQDTLIPQEFGRSFYCH